MISKNPSTKTLSSNDTKKKNRIERCTNDMQVLEQRRTQNTLSMLKYIQERFGKVKLLNNEDLKHFYRGKKLN